MTIDSQFLPNSNKPKKTAEQPEAANINEQTQTEHEILEQIKAEEKKNLVIIDNILTQLSEVSNTQELVKMFNERTNLEEIEHLKGALVETCQNQLLIINKNGKLEEFACNDEDEIMELHKYIKEYGEHFTNNSYLLRREVLVRSVGKIFTHEAYGLNLEKFKTTADIVKYIQNPNNWIEQRQLIHKALIASGIQEGIELSERLNEEIPTIYVLRGNTAAGKSTILRIEKMFQKTLDETGEPTGALNPDPYKEKLQKLEEDGNGATTNSAQCHFESSLVNKVISDELLSKHDLSIVMDQRFAGESDVEKIVNIAEQTGRQIKILDIESPLEISLIRVLARNIYEPRPSFDVIANGYEGIRLYRENVTNLAQEKDNVDYYLLYDANEKGELQDLAEKKDGNFEVKPKQGDRFDSVVYPSEAEVKKQIKALHNTKITQEYIMRASKQFNLRPNQIIGLERFIGSTFKEALDKNSTLIN